MVRRPLLSILICLLLAGCLARLAPFERSLGANAGDIQLFFLGLLALMSLAAWQLAPTRPAWRIRPLKAGK